MPETFTVAALKAPSPVKMMPLRPLFSAVTVELLMLRLPAERPWSALSENVTLEPFLMSKWLPLEPLPVLLMTSTVEASTVA